MNIRYQTIKGFSIIEVVLVLAIAGLIFLMVFVALPALQSGQRDTARKNDVSTVGAAVNTYASTNKGAFPSGPNANAVLQQYAENVSTNTTSITIINRPPSGIVTPADGDVTVVRNSKCGTSSPDIESASVVAGTTRQYVVITRLEAANGTAFCQEF